ncbi:hypothetical protein HPP92_001063 [Vanilla planifolia]|uniref:Uncharacterized protein n=1 Tax=Vanilla planifolia TaxID=51239 RepID=A0A835RZ67_VANPL|nr:hypothetical protein HPP92_001063 [Vanilla planifolia]
MIDKLVVEQNHGHRAAGSRSSHSTNVRYIFHVKSFLKLLGYLRPQIRRLEKGPDVGVVNTLMVVILQGIIHSAWWRVVILLKASDGCYQPETMIKKSVFSVATRKTHGQNIRKDMLKKLRADRQKLSWNPYFTWHKFHSKRILGLLGFTRDGCKPGWLFNVSGGEGGRLYQPEPQFFD